MLFDKKNLLLIFKISLNKTVQYESQKTGDLGTLNKVQNRLDEPEWVS